jgi:hypothetical protein
LEKWTDFVFNRKISGIFSLIFRKNGIGIEWQERPRRGGRLKPGSGLGNHAGAVTAVIVTGFAPGNGYRECFWKLFAMLERDPNIKKLCVINGFYPYYLSCSMRFMAVFIWSELISEYSAKGELNLSDKTNAMIAEIHSIGIVFMETDLCFGV